MIVVIYRLSASVKEKNKDRKRKRRKQTTLKHMFVFSWCDRCSFRDTKGKGSLSQCQQIIHLYWCVNYEEGRSYSAAFETFTCLQKP